MGAYLSLLAMDGTLVELGAPERPLTVPFFPLGAMRRSLSGSMIGGIAETQEMLDFCAEHGVAPEIEVIQPDYVNEAYERVLASDVRYRFVIDTGSL
jgi:alcohol dehydrogenase (NADP+)